MVKFYMGEVNIHTKEKYTSTKPHNCSSYQAKSFTAKKYSPGASSVPASSDPIMTHEAPSMRALMMWPVEAVPPSAVMGTPKLEKERG